MTSAEKQLTIRKCTAEASMSVTGERSTTMYSSLRARAESWISALFWNFLQAKCTQVDVGTKFMMWRFCNRETR
jgi:hypothetical protein